ncbi:hypothetical protein [Bacillus pseudomycoides]|uniref:hypothetical protein n=1 Tax=Bacillus pseudomycoides TaxID=64104 RepID=UPI000BF03893|nr:hypothetical protein [Bacillus pseudomycoides]PEM69359.1 hypothetical protein CN619_21740 [Bacillus pseudomycoides]PGA62169.1 hypothetical protein COL84_13415 [Bacillus pseudomycoides]
MAKVKNLKKCNSHFISFCKAHGLSEGDEWLTWDYMTWITRKASEFRKLNGLNEFDSLEKLEDGQNRFDRFLQVQI